MGQDIKKLFEETPEMVSREIPKGHRSRFESKLDSEFKNPKSNVGLMRIAASIALVVSLGFAGFYYFSSVDIAENKINSMADISPDLKKVEDYYLTHINYQFSKIKFTDDNRVFLEAYFVEMGVLQEQYKKTIATLNSDDISDETIDALIENLQMRLKLMYQLKGKLKKLDNLNKQQNDNNKA